jgi:hypothetical protein
MAAVAAVSAAVAGLATLGCDAGVLGRTGLDAMIQVNGGTLVNSALSEAPDPRVTDGPNVRVKQFYNAVTSGSTNHAVAGSVDKGTLSLAIGLADDVAYWIVPASTPDLDVGGGGDLLFSTTLSYSPNLPAGKHDMVFRSMMAGGLMGPASVSSVVVTDPTVVTGALVVDLRWDTEADLDLRVVAPTPPGSKNPTIEVWVKNPSSLPPRSFSDGGPYSPDELAAGGQLLWDSNDSCVIDGRRHEVIVWGQQPPSGHYIVRVDAPSMCGQAAARWEATATLNNISMGPASGQMGDADTRFDHGQGAGLTVLEFDVP